MMAWAAHRRRARVGRLLRWIVLSAFGGGVPLLPAAGQQPPRTEFVEEEVFPDPDWELRTLEGEELTLGELRGRPVFVNMWATWCPPCVAELASIERLSRALEGEVRFLLVSPEEPGVVERFARRQQMAVSPVLEATLAPEALGVEALPHTAILDSSGRLVIRHRGATDWDTPEVEALLRSLVAAPPEPKAALHGPVSEGAWRLELTVPDGWQIYAPRTPVSSLGLPLTAHWLSRTGRSEASIDGPEPTVRTTAAGPTAVHRGTVTFTIAAPRTDVVGLELEWALCRDDQCVPGRTRIDL